MEINHIDEICNLSDKALATIALMLQTQYKMGFEYACWGLKVEPNTEENLKKVLVPIEPDYLRVLIRARKGQVEVL